MIIKVTILRIGAIKMAQLTFNLDQLAKDNMEFISPTEISKRLETTAVIKIKDFKEMETSSFQTTSSEIRDFIQTIFGIGFVINRKAEAPHASNNRNQLNKLIKQVSTPQKYKKTVLNYNQYSNLIKLKQFQSFIIDHLQNSYKSEDKETMYKELAYLGANQYTNTIAFKEQKLAEYNGLANILNLLGLGDTAKAVYTAYLSNKPTNNSDEMRNLMEIVAIRQQQPNSPSNYRYDNVQDVMTTNPQQVIRHLLTDINRWNNE